MVREHLLINYFKKSYRTAKIDQVLSITSEY